MPALHITLGIYLKFFRLLESACKVLDIKYNAPKENENDLPAVCIDIGELERNIEVNHKTIDMIHETAALSISKDPEREEEIMTVFRIRIQFFRKS